MQTESNKTVGQSIDRRRGDLVESITRRHYAQKPELLERYGTGGRAKCLRDADYHLSYLSEAVEAESPELFIDYVAWAKVLLAGSGVPERDLIDDLRVMRDVLENELPPEESAIACRYIETSLREIEHLPPEMPTALDASAEPLAGLADEYLQSLLRGERHTASRLILDAVESGIDLKDVYLSVFQRSQHEIGRLWQRSKISVAQEHYCTAATQMIMSQLYPYVFNSEKIGRTMVATCVEGDYHEIGARMVADFFEMDGWDTFYLGGNVPTGSVLKTLIDRRADLIVISATMTFHVRAVRQLIKAIRASETVKNVIIMVGGYPFNVAPDLWREIGADAYSATAADAIETANRLTTGVKQK